MEYHKDDSWLFGPDNTSSFYEGWSMVLWLICLIVVSALIGCDGQAAEITAQAEQEAHDKKIALVSMPCSTWICQKHFNHEPCGRSSNTACAPSADLTERK